MAANHKGDATHNVEGRQSPTPAAELGDGASTWMRNRDDFVPSGVITTQRITRAPLPLIAASTSLSVAIVVSPGVVMASAPWAAP